MRDERAYLFDMLDSPRMVRQYIEGKSLDQFEEYTLLQDAVLRRLSIIGEAVRGVSPETRSRLPELRWSEMAAMRDILIHVYFGVDIAIVWNTATQDLPSLIVAVERLLG